jgi:4-hydroxy-4-methyl-2-oxoglutarate aldolase
VRRVARRDGGRRRVGDDDGVLFVPAKQADDVVTTAQEIRAIERQQALKIGATLRAQTSFADCLAKRAVDPAYSLRRHLRAIDGAIEE